MTVYHPRRRAGLAGAVALVGLLLATLLAACGGATTSPDDPYAILARSLDANYDRIKVQLGLKTAGNPEGDITIEPGAIEFVVDSTAGTGSFRLALPVAALGAGAGGLAQMGITGDTIDLEVLFDGEAVYAKSPLAAALLPMLMAQTGQTVEGDLTGWLQLGTVADFEAMGAALGAAVPSAAPDASVPPIGDLDPAQLKADLEEAGVVVSFVGTEQRNGAESQHVAITVDWDKLASSEMATQLPADQLSQLQGLAGAANVELDAWFDKASGALREIAITADVADGPDVQVTMLVSDPGAVSIEAPADFVAVPITETIMSLLQLFGGSLLG
jgi:hypothetical protein